jgi:hypothetical protein
MRKMLNGAGFLFLSVLVTQPGTLVSPQNEILAQTTSQAKDAKIDVKVVKYDGLKEAVTNLKGNLVVVDFWSTT